MYKKCWADLKYCTAGISGALLAYHLTHPENEDVALPEGHSILILEGSEVASSASRFQISSQLEPR
jgi:hypothetical protein